MKEIKTILLLEIVIAQEEPLEHTRPSVTLHVRPAPGQGTTALSFDSGKGSLRGSLAELNDWLTDVGLEALLGEGK